MPTFTLLKLRQMKVFVKCFLALAAAITLFSCNKENPFSNKWVLTQMTLSSEDREQVFSFQYDDQGRVTRATEDMKNVITMYLTYSYEQNTITRLMLLDLSKPEEWDTKTVFTLDNAGRVVKSVDEETQKTWFYTYSPDGFLVKVTDGENLVSEYHWKNNSLEQVTYAEGGTATITYSDKASLGLFNPISSAEKDEYLARLGYYGKNSRLLPAKVVRTFPGGINAYTVEYEYTSFDGNARLTGYKQAMHITVGDVDRVTTNTYKLTWSKLIL